MLPAADVKSDHLPFNNVQVGTIQTKIIFTNIDDDQKMDENVWSVSSTTISDSFVCL